MADYDACHNCYHKKCENIPRDVLNKVKGSVNRTVHIVKKYKLADYYGFRIILAEL